MKLRLAAGATVVAVLALAGPPQASHAAEPPARSLAASAAAGSYTVTLVTGDRVTVYPRPGGTDAVRVVKAPGRQNVSFVTHRTTTGLTVTPTDAIGLIAAKKLDQRLFDVALLKKFGYDDAHTHELPLLTTAPAGGKSRTLAGSTVARTIPAMGVTSVRMPKKDTGALWHSLTGNGKTTLAAGIGTLSLVGKLYPALDESAKQVGAPEAWAAGYTGAGVTVAVIDTGIDADHPDLQGVVTDARDFTGSAEGVKDTEGHGTHVAGIIAGRGTASNGRYTGIAKGVTLKVAKVCRKDGCPEDAVLAGMDWASNSGAKVINLSLGSPPEETGDLEERAVNLYTRTRGVLFVIAAGNNSAAETINSPGVAESALTVGSVDKKTDALSSFSSQGPRVVPSRRLDYAIKPDITAPGSNIVSARAAGTLDWAAVGPDYARLSGTSMATPHVTGAAAILAAQHPDWTPAALKAALTSTSKIVDGQTVYQQGAGRLDIARAATQPVTATGIVNLGYFPWPHTTDTPTTQTVTYSNAGERAVKLGVTLTVSDEAGNPAADGMFRASAKTITVQPGKTATLDVTIAPKRGKAGLYSGTLSAVSADGTVAAHSAIGAYKEAESYNMSLTQLNRKGASTPSDFTIINRKTGQAFVELAESTAIRRVLAGDYTVITISVVIPDDPAAEPDTVVEFRNVTVNQPTDLLFDARKGKPVTVKIPTPEVLRGDLSLTTRLTTARGPVNTALTGTQGHLFAVPADATIKELDYALIGTFVKQATDGPTPYTYNVALTGKGKLPSTPVTLKASDLAVVHQRIHRQHPDEQRTLAFLTYTPVPTTIAVPHLPLGELTSRDDYFTTVPGTTYRSVFTSGSLRPDGSNDGSPVFGDERTFSPGSVESDEWNLGVFGPGLTPNPEDSPARIEDLMRITVPMLSDARHADDTGISDIGSTTLSKDGEVLAENDWPGYLYAFGLPADEARYTVTATAKRGAPWAELSRQVDVTWNFTSKYVEEDSPAVLPLLAVRYLPQLDEDNAAPAGQAFTFPVKVERAAGAPESDLASLRVEVSYDGGGRWDPVTLTGAGADRAAAVTHPASGLVSLRATAADTAGNSVEQTIINAYRLK